MSKKKSLLKSGSSLSILTLFSRVLGLVREIIKSSFLGTTPLADAFAVAFMIPNLLRRLFAENSITIAFIPTFKQYLESPDTKNKGQTIRDFLSATFTLVTFSSGTVVMLGIIFAPLISSFFQTDFTSTVLLTRVMFPYLMLISIAAFFQGILNGVKVFSPSGFTPILFNIVIIGATYLLSPLFNNAALAMSVGVVCGGLVQAAFQLPFVLKSGFTFKLVSIKTALKNEGTKRVLRLIAPTILGMAAYQLNDAASTALASSAGTGVVSSLQYSLRLLELILGIFVVSVSTVILPDLAGYAAKMDWSKFEQLLLKGMRIIALVTIPAAFFSLLSSRHIIILIYQNRMFTTESAQLTLDAFQWHIGGLFFIALNRILAPAFYAQGDSRLPTLAGIISFGANITAAIILVQTMQGGGIALALTLAAVINTVFLFVFLRKKKTVRADFLFKQLTRFAVKITLFSVAASIPVYFFSDWLYTLFAGHGKLIAQGVPLIISLFVFSSIGTVLLLVSKDSTAHALLGAVLKKRKHNDS